MKVGVSLIPKRIMYCWFGGNKKSNLIKKCISSYKKICKDYEIIEINESNFDINSYQYAKDAYDSCKYAFVSDVARMDCLYKYGGITLDADVEVIKKFSDGLLNNKGFTSKESSGRWISATIACESNHSWVKKILKYYKKNKFEFNPSKITNTVIIDQINKQWFKKEENGLIYLHDGIVIYPRDYFECKNWSTGNIELTKNSYTVHHYTASWLKGV